MSQPKQRVGEYLLDEATGQCSYAEVWRAHHHLWTDQLAIVKIPTEPNYIRNLGDSTVRLPRLNHPNIVPPLGFDPAAKPPYLISEFLAGGNLRPWIAKRKLTVAQSVNILRQVLNALQYAYERGVVHGDLKPDNILLSATAASGDFAEQGAVKVSDFGVGVAMALTAAGAGAAAVGPDRMAYVAPEQRTGTPPDVKTDLYAVGVTLFEMLTGETPSGAELPGDLNADVPPWLNEVFRKSYARRERRFDTPAQFLAALPPDPQQEEGILRLAEPTPEPAPTPPRAAARAAPAPPPPPPDPLEILPEEIPPEEIPVAPPPQPVPEPAAAQSFTALDMPLEDDTHGPGEELEQTEVAAPSAGPVAPGLPRDRSRAEPQKLYDEMNTKQVRTPDDLRLALRLFFQGRRLDEGESANIRLRLIKWAYNLSGGQLNLDQNILLSQASNRPLYIAKLITRTMDNQDHPTASTVDHPAERAVEVLQDDDYRVVAHLSGDVIDDKFLEAAPPGPLRNTLVRLAQVARRDYWGRVARQDLILYRVNAIVAEYEFDGHPFRAFLAGNNLTVIAYSEPFTKIRQEPTKRAANLLDGEQIRLGISELHRGLESPQWQGKSASILTALRGKLAAAYMAEAEAHFESFGWLESVDMSAAAGQLTPSSDAPLRHVTKVRKYVRRMQFLPGLVICFAFVGLSILWGMDATPRTFGNVAGQVVQHPFFAGGVAALIAAIWADAVLGIRMSRTDVAFYHAMLLPTIIAGILALAAISESQFRDLKVDAICVGALAVVIVLDVLLFKYLGGQLLRPARDSDLVGDESLILSKIEAMLDRDWERLLPHYLALGPLYTFTGVQAASWQHTGMLDRSGEDSDPNQLPVNEPSEAPAPSAPTDPKIARLVAQIEQRITEAARALSPPAKMLLTLLAEYSKASSSRNLALMQTNAVKIEQKGQELTAKLADFDRLCNSPALQEAGRSEQLRNIANRFIQRGEEPDIQLMRTLADYARTFRGNSDAAMAALTPLMPQVQEVVDHLKQS